MLEKLTSEELEFCECFYNPVALVESLFSNYDNFATMGESDTDLANLWFGQYTLISYEYLLDYNERLNEKENFQLRKGSGDLYCYSGRNFGKTVVVEKLDLLVAMMLLPHERCGFSSYDALHIRGVLEDVVNVLEHHPFFRIFKARINRSPNYRITLPNGFLLESVNMNITGKRPGSSFFQKHFTRLYIEEASLETEQVFKQRRDSVSGLGCVFRISGMTNFTKYSPPGNMFYDIKSQPWVLNLPQYISPLWDEKEKAKAIKDFGGESSIGYRIFIKGEIVEDGISVFDMQRVRQNYDEKRVSKHFEITKKNLSNFEHVVIVERPKNASFIGIYADIGESAPSEVVIFATINEKYRYIYNITLYGLTDTEQKKFFLWLAKEVQANVIALDTTDGCGRAIFRGLSEKFSKEHLIWVSLNEKLAVDFEKDNNNNVIFKDGSPVYKEEYVSEWSVKHLKDLLYSDRVELPIDHKLDMQLNSIIAMQSGTRTVYHCATSENHLFQAFQVWAIAHWLVEFKSINAIQKRDFYKSGV